MSAFLSTKLFRYDVAELWRLKFTLAQIHSFTNSNFVPKPNIGGGGATLAQWIRLPLPSRGLGLKSLAHHLGFFH